MENNIENKYHIFEIINFLFIISFIYEIFLYTNNDINGYIKVFIFANLTILIALGIYGFSNKKNKIISTISLILGLSPVLYIVAMAIAFTTF
jgi:L-lactate permease